MNSIQNIPMPEIHKITVGSDPKNGFSFSVGQIIAKDTPNETTITKIFRDENHYFFFGVLRYIVYANKKGKGGDFVFRYFENCPVTVTPDSDSKFLIV